MSIFFNMEITEIQIQEIRNRFALMATPQALINLINFVNPLLYPANRQDKVRVIKKNTVNYYAHSNFSGKSRYKEFTIKKKSGGERKISAPNTPLKLIQSTLNVILSAIYEPKEYVTGFVHGRGIIDNAKIHANKNYVFNIDLKDFFPSIELHRIKAVLKLPPFNLNGDREKLAFMIANLSCHEGRLPQGSPTSPILSNIICQQLDRRLNGLAKKTGARFTRYADDITFSAHKDVFNMAFKTEMRRIIEDQKFTINEKKVRLQGLGYRQEVTGLIVNEKVNVSKKYIREIRAMLHNWEKLGYEEANSIFKQIYITEKGSVKKESSSLRNVLWGKLQFLGMVRGKEDALFLKYFEQFKKLESKNKIDLQNLSIADILAIWEDDGIERAIDLYYSNSTDGKKE